MAGEWSALDIKISKSRLLEIPRSNTAIVKDRNELNQKEERECGQEFFEK